MIYRLLSLPLGDKEYREELDTIKHIAVANGYDVDMVNNTFENIRKNIETLTDIKHAKIQHANTLQHRTHTLCLRFLGQFLIKPVI